MEILSLCNNRLSSGLDQIASRGLVALVELNLSGNEFSDFNQLKLLAPLKRLRSLDLRWNEIRQTPDFKKLALSMLPGLNRIDSDSSFQLSAGRALISGRSWREESEQFRVEKKKEKNSNQSLSGILNSLVRNRETAEKSDEIDSELNLEPQPKRKAISSVAQKENLNLESDSNDSDFSGDLETETSSESDSGEDLVDSADENGEKPREKSAEKHQTDNLDDVVIAMAMQAPPEVQSLPPNKMSRNVLARRPWKRQNCNYQGASSE